MPTKGPSYDPSELCERDRIQVIRFKSTIQHQRKEGRKEKKKGNVQEKRKEGKTVQRRKQTRDK